MPRSKGKARHLLLTLIKLKHLLIRITICKHVKKMYYYNKS